MLPLVPPALVRPADEPSRMAGVLQDFQAWIQAQSRQSVPGWNPWLPPSKGSSASRFDVPGATVTVWSDYPPLETETQEVLRLTVAWMIANRFSGQALSATGAPPIHGTGNWEASHPGGNRIPGNVPLGWRRWQ